MPDDAARAIRDRDPRVTERPFVGMVLGSGLGGVVELLRNRIEIPYDELPGFPSTAVEGHAGTLFVGELDDTLIVGMRGRVHLYEGHDATEIVHGVRTLARLGADFVLLTNAAGGIRQDLRVSDLMLITDHINLTARNPLIGPNDPELGPRFPDFTNTWSPDLNDGLREAAAAEGIPLPEGTYVGVLGPTYETPAEIRMFRGFGADAIGMSTVLEAIALRHMGCALCGISVITNAAAGTGADPNAELEHGHVALAAGVAGEQMLRLLRRFLADRSR